MGLERYGEAMERRIDPRGRPYFWTMSVADASHALEPGSDGLDDGIDGLLDELGRVVMMVYSRPAGNFFESSSIVHLIFSAGASAFDPGSW